MGDSKRHEGSVNVIVFVSYIEVLKCSFSVNIARKICTHMQYGILKEELT